MNTSELTAREARRSLAADPHRPRYHFTAPANWLNDPNGLIVWGGLTHLFYQYNPNGAFHGTIHWGHAVSRDLVHWEDWPLALTPTPKGPDAGGCWSGTAVDDDGVPTLLYTGLSAGRLGDAERQVQCLATSHDGLETWQKLAEPVIGGAPEGLELVGPPDLRDPYVWHDGEAWSLLLGSGVMGQGGAILRYRSPDLRSWAYQNIVHQGRFHGADGGLGKVQNEVPDTVWECPNLFSLGAKHVLLVSEQPEFKHTYYQLGSFDGHTFRPEVSGKTDAGRSFYAGLTLRDEQARRLLWGWLREGRSDAAQRAAGWSGVMSLPRLLRVVAGRLEQAPIPELELLRQTPQQLAATALRAGESLPTICAADNSYELLLALKPSADAVFTLTLCASAHGAEEVVISYDARAGRLQLDATRSSLDPSAEPEQVTVPHRAAELMTWRVFVDRSVLEVFADRVACVTSRLYPTLPDSKHIRLSCTAGTLGVALTFWPLESSWAEDDLEPDEKG